jgi:serine/threonine-protein kinase RsbW
MSVTHLPGTVESVGEARKIVHEALGDAHPAVADLELIVSELASNAVKHTKSGLPGGRFYLTVAAVDGFIRVTVRDQGSDGSGPRVIPTALEECAEGGRGMQIVDALATRWGSHSTSTSGYVYVELKF